MDETVKKRKDIMKEEMQKGRMKGQEIVERNHEKEPLNRLRIKRIL